MLKGSQDARPSKKPPARMVVLSKLAVFLHLECKRTAKPTHLSKVIGAETMRLQLGEGNEGTDRWAA